MTYICSVELFSIIKSMSVCVELQLEFSLTFFPPPRGIKSFTCFLKMHATRTISAGLFFEKEKNSGCV
jgi:hypothetical protein